MSNVLGKNLTLTLFGESHGPFVGATLDGLPSGIEVSEEAIAHELFLRRPAMLGETPRVENDAFQIVSGVYRGMTTGAPLTILIPNVNVRSQDYESSCRAFRPNHADYVANVKYQGREDPRGGGHFSGRITAAIVACGAIVKGYLSSKGIRVASHILAIDSIADEPFNPVSPEAQMERLSLRGFPTISEQAEIEIRALLEEVASQSDSIGGKIETAITGLPVGIGEPWFGRFDGVLSNAIMSIGGVRGVVFGDIDAKSSWRGSQFNDAFASTESGVKTTSNHSGGVQGGITNGMPVVFHAFVKPTPSIGMMQSTINEKGENVEFRVNGRHDPCFLRRIVPVINALTSIVVFDFLLGEYGRH